MTHYEGSNQNCEDFISWVTNECVDLDGPIFLGEFGETEIVSKQGDEES